MNNDITLLEDTSLVAFLMLRGHKVTPLRSKEPTVEEPQVRIAFEVHGDIAEDTDDYYDNVFVGISDYVKCLKSVRSSMFNMKRIEPRKKA
jgi:hypothetical protein